MNRINYILHSRIGFQLGTFHKNLESKRENVDKIIRSESGWDTYKKQVGATPVSDSRPEQPVFQLSKLNGDDRFIPKGYRGLTYFAWTHGKFFNTDCKTTPLFFNYQILKFKVIHVSNRTKRELNQSFTVGSLKAPSFILI